MAKTLADESVEAFITSKFLHVMEYIDTVSMQENVIYAMVRDMEGRVRAHSDLSKIGNTIKDPVLSAVYGKESYARISQSEEGVSVYIIAVPIIFRDEIVGVSQIGYSLKTLEKANAEAKKQIIIVALVSVATGVIVAFILARTFTNPISRLKDAAIKIGKGDLDTKIEVNTKDEIGDLAKSFDGMRVSLKESYSTLEQKVKERTRELEEALIKARKATEALRASKASFHNVVERSTDGIMVVDREGVVRFVNPAAISFFGRKAEELTGESFDFPIVAGGVMEIDIIRRGGEKGVAELRVVETEWEGGIAYLALLRDITERKRAEKQLQRYATELERGNEEVKQFAYIVSHDMRAPLVNLKGFAAELRAALAVIGSTVIAILPHLDERQQQAVTTALQEDVPEALGFIDSSVTRMDSFINAVLKLSRLGRRELHLELIDMNTLVQATLQPLAHQVEERQVKVTVDSLPPVVADRTLMEQIMGNLLINSVLYLDPDRPGEIEVTAKRGPDETTFHIRDNGRGIAEEDMHKVFAPFRRAGKQDVPGEGMGLAYVQTLMRRHGGRIWCESELGAGTTFTLVFSNHLKKGDDHA